jgi:hypothetical protein
MSLASNSSAGSILETLNTMAPASLELPIGDWPRQELLDSLAATTDLALASAESIARILMTTSLRRQENTRVQSLETLVRSRLPQAMLDQLDFTIATHLVNHDEYLRWVIQMVGGG